MPRTKPTTTYTTRSKLDYLLQESLGRLLLEDWSWAILLERSTNTLYSNRVVPTTTYS